MNHVDGIAVVVPTCDRPEKLRRAIASIKGQTRPADQIVIVDNGGEPIPTSSLPAEVTLLRAPARCGAGQARNIGAATTNRSHIAFLDDDDVWDERYLEIIEINARTHPPSTYFVGALHDMHSGHSLAGKNEELNRSRSGLLRRNPGFVGSNIVVPREHFLRIGGFDCRLDAGEDTDLAIRARESGAVLQRVPDARVLYDTEVSPLRLSASKTLRKSRQLLLSKHLRNRLLRTVFFGDFVIRHEVSKRREHLRV